jgi:hypothetical protein
MSWDGIALPDIIFTVVIARTEKTEPAPMGAKVIREIGKN